MKVTNVRIPKNRIYFRLHCFYCCSVRFRSPILITNIIFTNWSDITLVPTKIKIGIQSTISSRFSESCSFDDFKRVLRWRVNRFQHFCYIGYYIWFCDVYSSFQIFFVLRNANSDCLCVGASAIHTFEGRVNWLKSLWWFFLFISC